MKKLLSKCPVCSGALYVSALQCPDCGMELRGNFPLGVFDALNEEQYQFLLLFLKSRGSLKALQEELEISYPSAKSKLDELLCALNLADNKENEKEYEVIDVTTWTTDMTSTKASDIIKNKLKACGGRAIVHTIRGLPCEICAAPDGKSFICDKLPIKPPYTYDVFDVIVSLLLANGGRARKGNGRNYKLGEGDCGEATVVGAIAKNYAGKSYGDSVFDPVFALAAVLDWADIASNMPGELVLKPAYLSKL